MLAFGFLLVSGVLLVFASGRGDGSSAAAIQGGNFAPCAQMKGDAARECYTREVGRELAAVSGSSAPQAIFAQASSAGTTVTFASPSDDSAALLCDLHLRAGVTDESTPSWVSWNERPVS